MADFKEDVYPAVSKLPSETTYEESAYEKYVPQSIKNAVGGVESVGRMLWNVPAGATARGYGTLTGLGMGESLKEASQRGAEAEHRVAIPPLTKAGAVADEALGEGYDYVKRDVVAEAMLALDRHEWNALKIPKAQQGQLEAQRRSLYEGGFDAVMFAGLIRGGLSLPKALEKQRADLLAKQEAELKSKTQFEDGTAAKAPDYNTNKYNPQDLITEEPSPIPSGVRSPYNLPKEEIARLERELNPPTEQRITGQGELFTGERPYPEAFPGEGVVGRPEPSNRGREVAPREDILDIPDRTNQRVRPADELSTEPIMNRAPDEGIPYQRYNTDLNRVELSEMGTVGEARAKSAEEYRAALKRGEPIPFEVLKDISRPDLSKGPGARQRGAIDPTVFSDAAHKVYDGLTKKIGELQKAQERLASLWYDGKIQAEYFYRRGGEIVREQEALQKKQVRMAPRLMPDIVARREKLRAEGLEIDFGGPKSNAAILPFKGPGSKQRGAVGTNPVLKSLPKKGVVQTIQDFKKFWTEDTKRTLDQALKEDHPNLKPEEMTDVGDKTLLEKGLSNFLIDKQMAILSQGKGAISTVIKWVVDNQNAINRRLKEDIEKRTRAALDPWRALKKTSPALLRDMLTTWQENVGKGKLGPESFKSAKQWEVYEQINKVITEGHERVNTHRALADPSGKVLRPISFIENYFPSIRNGDWWIYIHDKGGNLKAAYAYPTKWQANKVHEVLKKDMGAEFEVGDVALKKLSQHDLSALDAFEETLRALHKNDPIAHAIQKRYSYLVGKRGFARTGIHRKGIEGALGFEEGKLGVKNSERVLESYINRQETYIANLERAQLQKEVSDISGTTWKRDEMDKPVGESTLFKNAPIAKQWIDEYLNRSKGADLDQLPLLRKVVDAISTSGAVGLSRGAVPRFLQKTSSVASLFYLATVRNLIVNMTQPINAVAKLTDMWQLSDKIPNPAHSFFDGIAEALSPDALSKEGREWAKKEGFIESAIVNLIEGKMADFKGEGAKLVGEAMRYSLGKVEQKFVRVPVFHMFEKALREEVPDKMQRFQMAGSLVDNYMVHYDRESSPLMYDKMGSVVGESTRGLKTYAHNTWGQFFEYIGTAKDQGRVAPLAAYMGTQALVGGLRGVFLVAEATAVITILNTLFDLDIPTPEQVMLKTGLNDMLVFGGASTFLGRDISASVSAPSAPQFVNFVPIEFGVNAVKESWNYLHKKLAGIETDQDAMRAMLAVTPKAAHGWIESLYSEQGENIPNPKNKMKGNFPTPQAGTLDYFERFGLGMKSLDEAKKNMIVRNAKQLWARDLHQKLDTVDAIVDRVENNENIPQYLIERYIKEGGNVKNLLPTIKGRMVDRQLDEEQRLLRGKTLTPDKMHKLDIMKDLMDDDLRKRIDEKSKGGFKKSSDVGSNIRSVASWADNPDAADAAVKRLEVEASQWNPPLKVDPSVNSRILRVDPPVKGKSRYYNPRAPRPPHGEVDT